MEKMLNKRSIKQENKLSKISTSATCLFGLYLYFIFLHING